MHRLCMERPTSGWIQVEKKKGSIVPAGGRPRRFSGRVLGGLAAVGCRLSAVGCAGGRMEGSSRRLLSHVSAQPYLPTRVHELRVTYLFAKYVRGGEEESVGFYRTM